VVDVVVVLVGGQVNEEDALADTVVVATETLIAIEAKTEAATFLHLGLGEALDRAALDVSRTRRDGRRRRRRRRCGSGQRHALWGRQDALLGRPRGRRGGRDALVLQLQLAGETHGDGERLWVVNLDVKAQRRLQSRREQLDLLAFGEVARAGKAGLKPLLEVNSGGGALAGGELTQRVRPERRPEPQIEQFGEAPPRWRTLLALHLDIPELRRVLEIVGGHPDLLLLGDALLMKEGLAAIDEC
jgi:hypothetical protein